MRDIQAFYADPLDVIWLATAAAFGFRVERDPEVFASWDGQQILRIGTPETLDPDDCLAQILLHEICHAMVAGDAGRKKPDWGLTYEVPEDEVYEQAALRLQAALSMPYGLRDFFGATTDYRAYYDRLPDDLALEHEETSIRVEANGPHDHAAHRLARLGWLDLRRHPKWDVALRRALQATARLRAIVSPFAAADSLWKTDGCDRWDRSEA